MRILGEEKPVLHAYLTSPLPYSALQTVQSIFHLNSQQAVNLVIHDEPRFYNTTAETIRQALDAEDQNTEDFVVMDKDVEETKAVWYIGDRKSDSDSMEDMIQPEDEGGVEVWKLRAMIWAVPTLWMNYVIGNSSIQEDQPDSDDPQALLTPYGQDERPVEGGPSISGTTAYVAAAPGEFEEGDGDLANVIPKPDRSYKLKEDVALRYGLRSAWTVGWPSTDTEDVAGTMSFAQNYI